MKIFFSDFDSGFVVAVVPVAVVVAVIHTTQNANGPSDTLRYYAELKQNKTKSYHAVVGPLREGCHSQPWTNCHVSDIRWSGLIKNI